MNDFTIFAESDLFVFIHLDTRLEPMIYFIARLVVDVTAYGLTAVPFFFNNSQSSNKRMKKCKSINILFFSPYLCCSNRKGVHLI